VTSIRTKKWSETAQPAAWMHAKAVANAQGFGTLKSYIEHKKKFGLIIYRQALSLVKLCLFSAATVNTGLYFRPRNVYFSPQNASKSSYSCRD